LTIRAYNILISYSIATLVIASFLVVFPAGLYNACGVLWILVLGYQGHNHLK